MTALTWDTHPDHTWLRGQAPDHPVEYDEHHEYWKVFGHAEALEVLGDPGRFSSDLSRISPEFASELDDGSLIRVDPPEHRKLRTIVNHAFTPKTVDDLAPRIDALATELLDAVTTGSWDLVTELAYPLPAIVIAELLGVPASDRELFREWANAMVESTMEPPTNEAEATETRDEFETLMAKWRPMLDYLREHAVQRRHSPRDDLLTHLVEAEVDGERLTDQQVVNFANVLLFAGHISTTMLLGNTVLCLDAFPEQLAKVRADRSLVPAALEESLRFLTPFAETMRVTTTEVELGGRAIPPGRLVRLWLAAANRDERVFDRPHQFDVGRNPNPHIGFGRGIHFCLGAPLARLEGRIVLNLLLDRFAELRTDPANPPAFVSSPDFTGVRTLPVLTR
ncbi:cytochrome P450 [Amycolatopsis sp. NPDC059027]|uniref:cytochrome P450 n=1 Tax=unclassified Amycolatopsis TaxID=2618356 RepID=UPI0036736112